MKSSKNKWTVADWAGGALLAISLIMVAAAAFRCLSTDIWYDELFTMGFVNHSVKELVEFTARDVHPPFYYLYVKALVGLFGAIVPSVPVVVIGKLSSTLPFFLLFGYAGTKVRRHFGLLSAGVFSFCLVTMPQLSQYTVEIRMYSLTLFLVTAAFLHAYELVCDIQAKEAAGGFGRKRDWICLCLFGILAAYTHYFAAVAVAMVYLYLLISLLLMKKRETRLFVSGGLCAGISVLAYIPWIFSLLSQVSQVKEEYWILPLTIRSLGGCVKFLLKPSFANDMVNVVLAVILFIVYGFLVAYCVFKEKEKARENGMLLGGIFVLAGVVGFGFLASFLLRPVFIYRYMLPAMGVFWLCFAVSFERVVKRLGLVCMTVILLLVVCVGWRDYLAFSGEEQWKKEQMDKTLEALEQIKTEDAVIFNFNHAQAVVGYYLPSDTYLWDAQPEALIREMFEGVKSVASEQEISHWLSSGRKVWFVGSGNAREELIDQWEKEGIKAVEKGSFLVERYWFNLYEVNIK